MAITSGLYISLHLHFNCFGSGYLKSVKIGLNNIFFVLQTGNYCYFICMSTKPEIKPHFPILRVKMEPNKAQGEVYCQIYKINITRNIHHSGYHKRRSSMVVHLFCGRSLIIVTR